MSIKCNDVGYAHCVQFFQCKSTVQRLSSCTLVLSAFVKERHDNIDTASLTCCSSDNSLQILIMVIWRHMVKMSVYCVSQAVVAYISHDKKISTTDCLFQDTLSFTRTESRTTAVYLVIVGLIVSVKWGFCYFVDRVLTEGNNIIIYLLSQRFAALHSNQFQRCNRECVF